MLIAFTITEKGPLIFLNLAQKHQGNYDAYFAATEAFDENADPYYEYHDYGHYMNYT